MIRFILCNFLLCCTVSVYASASDNCFDAAAEYQGVNAGILMAISFKENIHCDSTVHFNKNSSSDIGCMQINSVHLGELAAYGVKKSDLMDQCRNVFVGAWHYKKMVVKYGNTWNAVGAYHSENAALRNGYAKDVYSIWLKYRLYEHGVLNSDE